MKARSPLVAAPQMALPLGLVAPAKFAPIPPPPLWGAAGELLLPEEVTLIALDQPYCGLVAAGLKTLETRTWPWPYEPRWLAIYATLHPNAAAVRRLGPEGAAHTEPRGVVLALIWIGGSRLMVPEDEAAARISYAAVAAHCAKKGRGQPHAWIVGVAHQLARPFKLSRGPQKFGHVTREQLRTALAAPA